MMAPRKVRHADPEAAKLFRDVVSYLSKYVAFSDPQYAEALALWLIATYQWPNFDAFPYMVITADTKRSGKTRLAEVLSFACANPFFAAGVTPATIFHKIKEDAPVMFVDEAETLSSEAADTMRSVLNVGYRRGQVIPRMGKGGNVVEYDAYCPKVFILIGDVNDTLRDRSIVVRMKRSSVAARFMYETARAEGNVLGERMKAMADLHKDAILEAYYSGERLEFLQDRDEELWLPLFAIVSAFYPDRTEEFTRVAVDMATEKTALARIHVNLKDAERDAESDEYRERLLRDLLTIMKADGAKHVASTKAVTLLHGLTTGPWRKFRGAGLTDRELAILLESFDVRPMPVRLGKGRGSKVLRGYKRADVEAALKRLGE